MRGSELRCRVLKGRALERVLLEVESPAGLARWLDLAARAYGVPALRQAVAALPVEIPGKTTKYSKPRPFGDLRASVTARSASPLQRYQRLTEALDGQTWADVAVSPFRQVDRYGAEHAAIAAERRWSAGAPLGPLDGRVVAVKDDHRFSLRHPPNSPTENYTESESEALCALRRAGAVVLGDTLSTEEGMNPLGIRQGLPMPRNPVALGRCAGGSSTGAAVAVAMGLVDLALGSDAGGSVRIPAAWCGVYGLKPGFGRIPRWGTTNNPRGSLTTVGVISADPALLGAALIGTTTAGDAVKRSWSTAHNRGLRGARVGVLSSCFSELHPADPCHDALRRFEDAGARLILLDLPLARHAHAAGVLIVAHENARALARQVLSCGGGAELRLQSAVLSAASVSDRRAAMDLRRALRRQVATAFADLDLIALPATGCLPPPYPVACEGEPWCDDIAVRAAGRYAWLASLCGLPAGVGPVGTRDGCPVAVQVIAPPRDEAAVIAALGVLYRANGV